MLRADEGPGRALRRRRRGRGAPPEGRFRGQAGRGHLERRQRRLEEAGGLPRAVGRDQTSWLRGRRRRCASPAPLLAHDFWIEPTTFRPEVGSMVGLSLRVGQDFRGDPVPLMPDKIVKFVTVSAAGVETPVGRGSRARPGGEGADRGARVRHRRVPQRPVDPRAAGGQVRGLPERRGPREDHRGSRAPRATRKSRRRKSTRAARRRCSTREAPARPASTARSASGWSSFPRRARRSFRRTRAARSRSGCSTRASRSPARSSSR